jgi:hypothetical protein
MKPASEVAKDRQKIKNAYRRLFESADGRAVLDDLSREVGEDRDIFAPTPNETVYAVGKRAVLIYVKNMMKESE